MTDDLIQDENHLSFGSFPCHYVVRTDSRLEESHSDDSGDKNEDGSEEECDADVDDMCTRETLHCWEVLQYSDIWVLLRRVAAYYIQQEFHDRYEQKSNE